MSKTPHNTIMWEFTPPHGVSFQQWQTSFRIMFAGARLDEMLNWLDFQVQVIKDAMAQGKFYNEQPRAPQMPRPPQPSRMGKPRPEAVHATHSSMQRRREPRRGSDDAADPNSPPQKPRAPVVQTRANVQRLAGDAPMQTLTPGMAKPIPGKTPSAQTSSPQSAPKKETKDEKIARMLKELQELQSTPEVEYEDMQEGPAEPIQPEEAPEETPSEAQSEESEAPQADLSGPRIHRHRWPGPYTIGETCVKCGTECTGTEELCPVP